MSTPGRLCPLNYRTDPGALNRAPDCHAETLYVIGGLYGNTAALDALLQMASEEVAAGLPAPRLVFNGDFNWLNVDDTSFQRVNSEVLQHRALQGNVEAELAAPDYGAGCGCAYPEWVDDATVARSNAIMQRLQRTAAGFPGHHAALNQLPRQLLIKVGSLHVGVIHGDPESLAGWGLALEHMPAVGTTSAAIDDWFRRADVDLFACSHTCIPFVQRFTVSGRPRAVLNNGAAGMPNFRGDRRGVVTRISTKPTPDRTHRLYGLVFRGVHCEALGVPWATPAWDDWFHRTWPPGSPAAESYSTRLRQGPNHSLADAWRIQEDTAGSRV